MFRTHYTLFACKLKVTFEGVQRIENIMKKKNNDQADSDFPTGLGAPAQRALAGAGYSRLEQLIKVTEADIKKLHGVGPHAINKLRAALEAKGLSFANKK